VRQPKRLVVKHYLVKHCLDASQWSFRKPLSRKLDLQRAQYAMLNSESANRRSVRGGFRPAMA
jgi:hypothetical protein